MDPNANRDEQLRLASGLMFQAENARQYMASYISPADVLRLAELVIKMDHWITAGGFLPSAWLRTDSA